MSIPLPALALQNQQPNPLDQYGKLVELRALMQGQQQRQAMAPLEQQQAQGAVVAQQQENQQRALQLKDQQGISQALHDIYSSELGGSQGQPAGQAGTAPSSMSMPEPSADRFNSLIQSVQDPKYGISPAGQMGVLKSVNDMRMQTANLSKTDLANREDANKQIAQHVSSILSAAPEDQPAQYQLAVNAIKRDPTLSQYAQNIPPQYPGAEQLTRTLQTLSANSDFLAWQKQGTELPGEAAKSQQEARAAAPPNSQQTQDALANLKGYSALPTTLRNSFSNQIKNAPDWQTLQATMTRAEQQQNANQMHLDSMAQTRAMMGNKFAEAGLTENDKMWTDPQRGFAGAIAQANQTKAAIVAGANGNALLTNMVPTMEVLGINHAAGINRISPQEAESARVSPEWATRWNAWADKVSVGKLSPELAKEGNQLMDVVIDAAHQRALQSAQLIAKGHGLDPSQVPAMDISGNLTTLDKAGTPLSPKKQNNPGATHQVMNRADGKMHWTDAASSKDMGVVQ